VSLSLVLSNLLSYALQIAAVAAAGACIPYILRIRMPRARLLFWQVLLAACLALPWVRPWRHEVVTGAVQVSAEITSVVGAASVAPVWRNLPYKEIALWLLAAGVLTRLLRLGVGLTRLTRYRARGTGLPSIPVCCAGAGATLLLSEDVTSPVTFGWRDPVVLLPSCFPDLGEDMQEAILCHELEHVARRDWLFTLGEELVRAVLWFHPAVWWVIGEIQLAREQTVDLAVIDVTGSRATYVDALLLMAGAPVSNEHAQMDLAPAPMFLRRRHLKKRLIEAMREVQMTISKTRMICTQTLAVAAIAGACWLATGTWRLTAAPQLVADAPGVAVNVNGSQLMHRASVPYPADALAKGVEGTIVVQMKLDANGEVADASILSGPDEFRKAVLQSVLSWHFDKSVALTTRVVNIDFVKPAAQLAGPAASPLQPSIAKAPAGPAPGARAMTPPPPPPPLAGSKLSRIQVNGLSDISRSELLARLPVHEGDTWSPEVISAVTKAVREYDPHLTIALARTAANGGELELRISVLNSTPLSTPNAITFAANGAAGSGAGSGSSSSSEQKAAPLPAGVYSVGGGVSPPSVLSKVDPVYPEDARDEKVAGTVQLSIVVGIDGKAEDIQVVRSVDSRFDPKAIDAVTQWVFKPGMKDGLPVKVRAQIEINFRLL
jgi:protein TonB